MNNTTAQRIIHWAQKDIDACGAPSTRCIAANVGVGKTAVLKVLRRADLDKRITRTCTHVLAMTRERCAKPVSDAARGNLTITTCPLHSRSAAGGDDSPFDEPTVSAPVAMPADGEELPPARPSVARRPPTALEGDVQWADEECNRAFDHRRAAFTVSRQADDDYLKAVLAAADARRRALLASEHGQTHRHELEKANQLAKSAADKNVERVHRAGSGMVEHIETVRKHVDEAWLHVENLLSDLELDSDDREARAEIRAIFFDAIQALRTATYDADDLADFRWQEPKAASTSGPAAPANASAEVAS